MLINPFTPSEIASNPDEFFGRADELRELELSLRQGSVAILGAIGIGKSSLLARGRLLMEGFDSEHRAKTAISVGDRDVQTVDQAARLLLESFVTVDERQEIVTFKLGRIFEKKSAEICRNFVDGRHVAVLKRIVEREYLDNFVANNELLLLAVDEADKCPVALARLIRSISTHTQQQGIKRVRFLLAGVSLFFQRMVDEDPGINRFFYKTIVLEPMPPEEATDLVETKLLHLTEAAEKERIELRIDPEIISRVVALSGGHPHILQLLGSHLVQHENEDPDGTIDSRDLVNSLRRICYEDRARVYDSTLHMLELNGKMEALSILFEQALPGFPTCIPRRTAVKHVGKEGIQWMVDNNVISPTSAAHYALVDEFLRVRLLLDQAESAGEQERLESHIIRHVAVGRYLETALLVDENSLEASDGLDSDEEVSEADESDLEENR